MKTIFVFTTSGDRTKAGILQGIRDFFNTTDWNIQHFEYEGKPFPIHELTRLWSPVGCIAEVSGNDILSHIFPKSSFSAQLKANPPKPSGFIGGIRIGTPAVTSRGLKEEDMYKITYSDKQKEAIKKALVEPVTIITGALLTVLTAKYIGIAASSVGKLIIWTTNLHPFWMGMLVSAIVGIALTLPISSAAICAALGLTGLAGGAAVAGCCAQMVGFAVMSFKENRWGGILSQGLGTSMLQMPNIIKNPKIWIPPILASIITGPVATCIFKMEMNGAPVSSGMGTCGLVGQIGVITGWLDPSAAAVANGAVPVSPGALDWIGILAVCFVLPAVLSWAFGLLLRKINWIKEGDLLLQ